MMSGVSQGHFNLSCVTDKQSTGLTPYMNMEDPQMQYETQKPSTSSSSTSRLESQETSNQSASTGPSILSPNNIFNFSPCPMGDSWDTSKVKSANDGWASGNVGSANNTAFEQRPNTRTEGPWRDVETVDSIFGNAGASGGVGVPLDQQPTYDSIPNIGNIDNTNAGPAQEFVMDEVLQQKILMDLFWPGWPPNLPEPNIVNDLYVHLTLVLETADVQDRIVLFQSPRSTSNDESIKATVSNVTPTHAF
jgi:hypothetical protein